MSKLLRALIVEDSENDVLLLLRHLKQSGYEVTHRQVWTEEAMRAALNEEDWDVVFSDFTMPVFSAPAALEVLHERAIDVPFIVVSGSIGEARAVEIMRAGAHDYVMKDSLLRLSPVIEREMKEAASRRARRREQEELIATTARVEALNVRLQRALHETHHRVKNNLQIIIAMIEMQALDHREAGLVPIDELRRLGNHIRSLAIVHDILTKSLRETEEEQRLSAKVTLDTLLPLLQQTTGVNRLRYRAEDVELLSKQCVALALVVNELVSNAVKHGQGEVVIGLSADDGRATLAVCDDGPGFPEAFDPATGAHLGLELVQSIVATDLFGEVHYDNPAEGGARVRVTFPISPPPEEPS